MLLTFFSFSWQYCTFILANYLLFKTSHLTRWWICYAVVLVLLGGSGFERSSTGASMWRVCVQSPVIVQHRWRRHPHFFYCTLQKKKQQQKYQRVIFRSAVGGAADGAGHQNQNHRGHAREHKQQPLTHAHCATAQTGDVHSQITEWITKYIFLRIIPSKMLWVSDRILTSPKFIFFRIF